MRRVLCVLLFLGLGMVALAPSAIAGDAPVSTTTVPVEIEAPSIIPQPNSGVSPTEAGDRGGALQAAVFAGIVVGLGAIAVMIVRQSRRVRADRPGPASPD